jgi:DNA-directed RNA polymerase subunit RPC12/RpoP
MSPPGIVHPCSNSIANLDSEIIMATPPADSEATQTREPSTTSAPPAGRKFPCAKCGAKLDFDPSSRALQCPYCGYTQVIEPSNQKLEEHDLEAQLRHGDGGGVLAGRSTQVRCAACNAIVLLEDKVATDHCPYCGTHLENKPEAAETMIKPEGVIPFAVAHRDAIGSYERWLKGLWFAPTALRQFAILGQLGGIYVPYWTFDSMTYTHYTGQRGEDYTDTESYTETDAQGLTVSRTRNVTKTRWYSVSGEVRHFFDDVCICASQGVPPEYAPVPQPSELKKLLAFSDDYLSGFKTERYTVGPKDGFDQAKAIMDGKIRELCTRDIGGDHQRLETVQTQHVGVTFKHILLPIWLASYRYREKVFRVLVNGQTGEVQGDRPYSWAKIGILIAVILAVLLALLLVFHGVARGARQDASPPQVRRPETACSVEPETKNWILRTGPHWRSWRKASSCLNGCIERERKSNVIGAAPRASSADFEKCRISCAVELRCC